MRQVAELTTAELRNEHASLLAVIANRVDPEHLDEIVDGIGTALEATPAGACPSGRIPEDRVLVAPTMRASSRPRTARARCAATRPCSTARRSAWSSPAMSMENVLPRLTEGAVVVVPGDRSDVLVATVLAHASETFPSLAGIILNGGFDLAAPVDAPDRGPRLDPADRHAPTSAPTTRPCASPQTRGRLAADSPRKYDIALAAVREHVDGAELLAPARR